MTTVIARSRRLAGKRASAIAARVWHLMNLPAGTDLRRLRMQVGALDREVRRLSLQLDRDSRKPDESFDRAALSEPDERRRTRASRGRTQRAAARWRAGSATPRNSARR